MVKSKYKKPGSPVNNPVNPVNNPVNPVNTPVNPVNTPVNTPDKILNRINNYKESETIIDSKTGEQIEIVKFSGEKVKTNLNNNLTEAKNELENIIENVKKIKNDKILGKSKKNKNPFKDIKPEEAADQFVRRNTEINLQINPENKLDMGVLKDSISVNFYMFEKLKEGTINLLTKINFDEKKISYLKKLHLDFFREYVIKINNLNDFFKILDLDLKQIKSKINKMATKSIERIKKERNEAIRNLVLTFIIIGSIIGIMTYENFTDNNFNEIENYFNEFKKRIKEHIDNDTFDQYKYNLFVKEMGAQLDYFSKKYNYSMDYILKRLNISTNIYELPLEQVIILNKLKFNDNKNELDNLNYIIFARNLYNRLSIIDKKQFLKLSVEDQDIIIKDEYKRIFNNIKNNIKKNNDNNSIINNINNNLISYKKVINIYYIIIIIAIILFIILFLK